MYKYASNVNELHIVWIVSIQQLIREEVEMQHKSEINVKLKVILEKMEDIFTPVDAAFIKKNK